MGSWQSSWYCRKQLPTSLFHKRVVWCHWWPPDWSVHLSATSDRAYLSQRFATWTANTLKKCPSTNTTKDVLPPWWSAASFQSDRQAVSESKFPNRWIGRGDERFATTVTGSEPFRLTCVELHESYGVCTQGECERRTTTANSQRCKKHQQRSNDSHSYKFFCHTRQKLYPSR